MWTLLLVSTSLAQECTSAELQLGLDEAEGHYQTRDKQGFLDAMARNDATLTCMRDPATPALSASLHRMVGLRAFLEREDEEAALAFAAARSLEPAYTFPTTVVPEQHPVQDLYERHDPDAGSAMVLAPTSDGHLRFDGHRAEVRSTSFPQLFQHLDSTGAVTTTVYLWPSASTPDYPVGKSPETALPKPLAEAAQRPVELYVEFDGGIGKGGIARVIDHRVVTSSEGDDLGGASADGLTLAQGFRLGAGFGLRFSDSVEVGFRGNLILGSKQWTSGSTIVDEADLEILEYEQDTVEAQPYWLIQLEPRFRIFFAQQPAGSFYWLTGVGVTAMSRVEVEPGVRYPGRQILGVTLGGGAMWALGDKTGFFLEIPFTLYLLGHGVAVEDNDLAFPQPTLPTTTGWLYSGTLGIERRF